MNGMMVTKNVFNIDVLIDTMMTRLFHLAEHVINHCALTACVPAAHAATAVAPVAISTPSGESPAEPAAPVVEQVFAPAIPHSNEQKARPKPEMVEGELFQ